MMLASSLLLDSEDPTNYSACMRLSDSHNFNLFDDLFEEPTVSQNDVNVTKTKSTNPQMNCDEDDLATYLTEDLDDGNKEIVVDCLSDIELRNAERSLDNTAFAKKTENVCKGSPIASGVQQVVKLTSLPVNVSQIAGMPQIFSIVNPVQAVSSVTSTTGLCMSKQAVSARENRQKKKNYFDNLEGVVQDLETENGALKSNAVKMHNVIDKLSVEVAYLKSVVANQSTLSSLLCNICNTPGVNFTSSMSQHLAVSEQKENHCGKDTMLDPVGCVTRNNKRKSVSATNKKVKIAKLGPRLTAAIDSKCGTLSKKDAQINGVSEMSFQEKNDVSTNATMDAGICLHVSSGSVSLEFCAHCSKNASLAWKATNDHTYGRT